MNDSQTKLPSGGYPNRRKEMTISVLKQLLVLGVVVIFLRTSVVEAFRIPSASMEPTLLIGDHILVNKLSYGLRLPLVAESVFMWDTPERGDIVVFTRMNPIRT